MVAAFLFALALLLLLNAFFVLAEFAVIRVRNTRVEELVEQGDEKAQILLHIHQHLDEYLSVCQLGITFASIALGFVGEPAIARLVEPLFAQFGGAAAAHGVAVTLAYVVVSFLHILIGELVPKSMAIRDAERSARVTAKPLVFFRRLFVVPLVVLNHSTNLILRLMRLPAATPEERHSEDEIRLILGKSQTHGVMSFVRLLLLENVFDFGALRVRDAMRNRSSVKVLRAGASWETNLQTIRSSRLSRFPLLDEKSEQPVGIVHVKDVFYALERGAPIDLLSLARPCVFLPETMPIEKALMDLQRKRTHLAIVGRRSIEWTGILTLEDIVEELVGAIEDEFEVEPSIYLADALSPGRIVLGAEGPTLENVLRSVFDRIPSSELSLSKDTLLRLLLEPSRLARSYLGHELAIPHARAEGLPSPLLFFVRSDEGIPQPDRDERSRLHFILITPSHLPGVHVRLLSRIARILQSEYVDERLREAETPEQIMDAIRAAEAAVLG